MEQIDSKEKANYYTMLVGTNYVVLTIDDLIDILNYRVYKHLHIDYLRIIFANLKKCKDTVEWYKDHKELDESFEIYFEASDTKEGIYYELGQQYTYKLALLDDDVYRDFFTDFVDRLNISINNLYIYSNVYGDDPMLEFGTYLTFIHTTVAWYLGDKEAKYFVERFYINTRGYLKRQGFTEDYLGVYKEKYERYDRSPIVEEGRKLRNPKIIIDL